MQNEIELLQQTIYANHLKECAIYIASQSDNLEQADFNNSDLRGFNEPDIYYMAGELVKFITNSKIFVLPEDANKKIIALSKIISDLRNENYIEYTVGGYKHYKLTTRAIEAYKKRYK